MILTSAVSSLKNLSQRARSFSSTALSTYFSTSSFLTSKFNMTADNTNKRLPVYFISHGGPNQAVDESPTADFFAELGKKWTSLSNPKPSSILVISGHWEGDNGVIRVRTSEKNQLYYDFYGFPDHMYKLQYPSKGSPELANRVLEILGKAGIPAEAETERGIDHGLWVPFLRILPKPDIPIVQVSLAEMRHQPAEKAFEYHVQLGRALRQLREENVLIVASGTAVHNLRDIGLLLRQGVEVAPYTEPFDQLLDTVVLTEGEQEREEAAIKQVAGSKLLRQAHPSLDHLLPFHVAIGAAGGDKAKILHKRFALSLSDSAYSFGEVN